MEKQTSVAIFAVILLIVGMAVAGLLYTFTMVLQGQTYELVEDDIEAITSYTVEDSNDSITLLNNTWVALGNTSINSGNYHLYCTNNTEITAFLTWNLTTGRVWLDNTTTWVANGTSAYSAYNYDDGTIRAALQDGILASIQSQQQIGEYMPIIALAIIITIVISLIIGGIASKFMSPQMGFKSTGGYGGVL